MWFMGGFVIATYHRIDTLGSAYYTLVPAAVMVFLGIIFFLAAVTGFCGVFRQSRVCSLLFFAFVFLIFVFLITAIILSFVYKSEINQAVETESRNALEKFTNKTGEGTTDQVQYLQGQFKCCGSYNSSSWENTTFGRNHTNFVPVSCCKNQSEAICFRGDLSKINKTENLYEVGCVGEVEGFLKKNLYYLGAGGIAFLVLLVFGMLGSCYVMWQKKDESYFNLGS